MYILFSCFPFFADGCPRFFFFFFTFLDLNETHQNRHSQINCGLQGLLPTHVWVSNLIILILTYSLCMRLILYLYGLQIQRLARRKVNWFFSY